MAKLNVATRWRELANPVSPYDPIQPDGPRLIAGKLPTCFIILCWDGKQLMGPYRFDEEVAASAFMKLNPGVTHYLIVPSPNETYEPAHIPGL